MNGSTSPTTARACGGTIRSPRRPRCFLGDGARGLYLEATPPGLNRVGGFGYDGARGVLFVSDSVENTVIAIQ